MTVNQLLQHCAEDQRHFQLYVNGFLDEFRAASSDERGAMIVDGPQQSGKLEGLVAAIVSALCREAGLTAPGWVERVGSPDPFFVFPARDYALRLRLMLESPPPFRARNVFVPENYLARA